MSPQPPPRQAFGQRSATIMPQVIAGVIATVIGGVILAIILGKWNLDGPKTETAIRGLSPVSVLGEEMPTTPPAPTTHPTVDTSAPPVTTFVDPTLPELIFPEVASYATATTVVQPLPQPTMPTPTATPETTPITAAPPIAVASSEPSSLEGDEAADFFRGYLRAAGARQYDLAWAMLSPEYQTKYQSFERFSAFWNTIKLTGFEPSRFTPISADSITITVDIWFDLAEGGRQYEIVAVDIAVVQGQTLITDYRWLETLS